MSAGGLKVHSWKGGVKRLRYFSRVFKVNVSKW